MSKTPLLDQRLMMAEAIKAADIALKAYDKALIEHGRALLPEYSLMMLARADLMMAADAIARAVTIGSAYDDTLMA